MARTPRRRTPSGGAFVFKSQILPETVAETSKNDLVYPRYKRLIPPLGEATVLTGQNGKIR